MESADTQLLKSCASARGIGVQVPSGPPKIRRVNKIPGCSSEVECLVWDQEVAGSIPVTPTKTMKLGWHSTIGGAPDL